MKCTHLASDNPSRLIFLVARTGATNGSVNAAARYEAAKIVLVERLAEGVVARIEKALEETVRAM